MGVPTNLHFLNRLKNSAVPKCLGFVASCRAGLFQHTLLAAMGDNGGALMTIKTNKCRINHTIGTSD